MSVAVRQWSRRGTRRGTRCGTRTGTTLPFVLVALAVVALLVLSFTTASWQALRAATVAAHGTRAREAAADVLASRLAAWPDDSVVFHELGVARTGVASSAAGMTAQWRVVRTHPLAAWIDVTVQVDGVEQGVTRTLWLEPPVLPLDAALATLSDVRGRDPSRIDAAALPFDTDRCDAIAPSALPPLVATSAAADGGPWTPVPTVRVPPASWRVLLDAAWPVLRARTAARSTVDLPVTLPPAGWQAVRLDAADSVLTGIAAWRGLLLMDGPLTIDGALSVTGVLAVRGPLRVRGTLDVRGAVLVDDPAAGAVTLGGASTLTGDRCAVAFALATVARPRFAPFDVWHAVTW